MKVDALFAPGLAEIDEAKFPAVQGVKRVRHLEKRSRIRPIVSS